MKNLTIANFASVPLHFCLLLQVLAITDFANKGQLGRVLSNPLQGFTKIDGGHILPSLILPSTTDPKIKYGQH